MDATAPPSAQPSRPPNARAYGFNAAYTGAPAWDIGYPQRAVVDLVEEGLIRGRVLDVGCGTGEHAIYFDRLGHEVLGVDFAPLAIERARRKARRRGSDARFLVWDALRLSDLAAGGLRFDTAVDSAMLHCLGGEERRRFVAGLHDLLRDGGRYYALCAAAPDGVVGQPGWVSVDELRALFAEREGWRLEFVRESAFETRRGESPAYLVGATRL